MEHYHFLHRCLALAERGRGNVGINPLVGAVLVREGKIIAEAYHSEFGKAHAERQLLENHDPRTSSAEAERYGARQIIRSTDTLYVNLEPCCHQGKTPACTDVIIERGVKHVVFGMIDPDPRVAGKGIACLKEAGIEVIGPVLRAQCEWFNRGFVSLKTKGRPWVTLRRAQTRSGAIAKPDGGPLKITSVEQDRWTHGWLRARHDAIVVGVQTVIADDPLLTVRFSFNRSTAPLRFILDPRLRIPLSARVVNAPLASGTMVVTGPGSDAVKRRELEGRGVPVAEIPLHEGRFDFPALWKVLTEDKGDFHGISSVLVEGGARTWQSFREAGVVDEEVTLMGP